MENEIIKKWLYIKNLFKDEKYKQNISKFEYEINRILREQKLKRILN